MSSINSQSNFGLFVPTTNVFEIQSANIDQGLKNILVRLYQDINTIALSLNGKDSGIYDTQEFLTGKIYYPSKSQSSTSSGTANMRPVFRKIINTGPLPNAGTISVPHNIPISGGYFFTQIYGTASNQGGTSYIPLPASNFFVLGVNQNIKLEVTDTNVVITTADNFSTYVNSLVTLEYIKVF